MNEAGTSFLLPDGWSTMEFFAESDGALSRPATPMDICEFNIICIIFLLLYFSSEQRSGLCSNRYALLMILLSSIRT